MEVAVTAGDEFLQSWTTSDGMRPSVRKVDDGEEETDVAVTTDFTLSKMRLKIKKITGRMKQLHKVQN